jgi:short-subunit dehydrogenase
VKLEGAHIAITGGSRGIGAALASAFAKRGARLSLVARDESRLRRTADVLGARAIVADLRDPEDVIARLEDIAPVDILVNNAGIDATGALTDLSAAALRDLIAVNVTAPVELARQQIPAMAARGSGRIVFVSSLSGQIALPGMTAYSATKAAITRLAAGLRTELSGSGVAITLVEIGTVDTEMYSAIRGNPAAQAALRRLFASRGLRLLRVEEVAAAVVRACEKDRGHVVLPRRAWAQSAMLQLPQRVVDAVTS